VSLLLKKISLPLGRFILEVDVEIHGRVTAILGPSGSGKTSLLDLIAGLRKPDHAFIQLGSDILTDTAEKIFVPAHRRGLGYVPQDLALFPHLSVRQNLLYGRRGGPANDPVFGFEHVVDVLDIRPLVARGVDGLSGGEKQRVALARALLAAPRLLLLDEPLANLDSSLKNKIIPYLARIRDEFHVPMLYVTHDRYEAVALADEVVVLMDGKVRQTGPLLDVFNRPANADVAKFAGVETLLPGVITQVDDELVTVQVGRSTLTVLAPPAPLHEVFVCIRGEDVMLQRNHGTPGSARNRLPALVMAMRPEGALVRVELDAGFPLFALITRSACAELALQEGEEVVVLIKAPSIHLVPRGGSC
jgi:molybdate transport system ATP-binding protein